MVRCVDKCVPGSNICGYKNFKDVGLELCKVGKTLSLNGGREIKAISRH